MRRILGKLLLVMLLAVPAQAQITLPFSDYRPGQVIASGEANANFGMLADRSLNRAGGTITGHITVNANITIDGVDVSDFLLTSVFAQGAGVAATPAFSRAGDTSTGVFFAAGAVKTTLSGTERLSLATASGLTVFGTTAFNTSGKIPALTATYFANLAAQDLQLAEGSFTDGAALARLAAAETVTGGYVFSGQLGTVQTWSNGGTTYRGLLATITNTASAAASRPLNVSIGGAAKLDVTVAGKMTATALQVTDGATNGEFLVGDANGVGTWTPSATSSPVPSGMLAFFEAACPAGWTSRSGVGQAYENKMVRGGATYDGIGAGADSHTHSIDPPATASGNESVDHTHTADPVGGGTSSAGGHSHSMGGSTGTAGGSHTHTFTTGEASASRFADEADLATPSTHTHSGTTDATNIDHSHGTGTLATDFVADHSHSIDYASTASGGASTTHTHTLDVASFSSGSASNIPAYVQVIVCRKD